MKARTIAAAVCGALLCGATHAESAPPVYKAPEETATLPPGPNVKIVEQYCGACHSYEYILTQPRGAGFGRDYWQASVTKMINVFGAPIKENDANAIVDYLSNAFGVTHAESASPVYKAPEETATLPPGPNVKVAEEYCGVCHSYEYILTQPRGAGFGRDFWQGSVTKMIKVFGAPIPEAEANAIVDYLSNTLK